MCICLSLTSTGDKHMSKKDLEAFAREAAKSINMEADLAAQESDS